MTREIRSFVQFKVKRETGVIRPQNSMRVGHEHLYVSPWSRTRISWSAINCYVFTTFKSVCTCAIRCRYFVCLSVCMCMWLEISKSGYLVYLHLRKQYSNSVRPCFKFTIRLLPPHLFRGLAMQLDSLLARFQTALHLLWYTLRCVAKKKWEISISDVPDHELQYDRLVGPMCWLIRALLMIFHSSRIGFLWRYLGSIDKVNWLLRTASRAD